VLVTDVYAAGEQAIEGAGGRELAEAIGAHGHHAVRYVSDREELVQTLCRQAQPGDVVIALGAGNINRILAEIEQVLQVECKESNR
jgi:UDP-N-acetylmuramate--alanine ligase